MQNRGFIFSLDAFVAFVLTMLTIGLLIFTISTPKAFYPSLEQAHILAHDTLFVLATTTDDPSCGSYLEQALSGTCGSKGTDIIMRTVAGGEPGLSGIIPSGFGYKLEKYNFGETGEPWETVYDSAKDSQSDRHEKQQTKLAASATTFASLYLSTPKQGESPFCYVSCSGYIATTSDGVQRQPKCDVTPCSAFKSNFDVGDNSIQLVRLTVYT